ncbi:hypothetical protein FE257_002946 [Aspergillus nanangensis]|uniref:DUF159 domain protein n=1 Tax=Aspergillus nanangensis TaxID=2582783 RepID=A0AAD4CT34_ASPNN|nr:hypothetical protein FE257_002946 [Aspergillus nanangensis]
MAFVRHRLQEQGMQVDEAPQDDEVRETYNFAPGYNGVVYRAAVPTCYSHAEEQAGNEKTSPTSPGEEEKEDTGATATHRAEDVANGEEQQTDSKTPKYKLQSMRWGLIPFWTKRQPDYGSLMRTINCRDDSLIEDRGMWTSMKRRKRCVVVCQGFYEWLKKGPGGKEKIPHFIKRKDGDLMYLAGLWDCVSYEVITTSSNPYLKFIHDRMPVILEPNSEAMKTWLDPNRTTWSRDLQSILKPYEGELECYPVSKDVGKVGNNSSEFIIPVKENKGNIVNFFANAKKKAEPEDNGIKHEKKLSSVDYGKPHDSTEKPTAGVKRGAPVGNTDIADYGQKKAKSEAVTPSPQRPTRNATHNQKSPKKHEAKRPADGSQRITKFFQK